MADGGTDEQCPFARLAQDTTDFCSVSQIARISRPTPLHFLREFVSRNRPCIITSDATRDWPCMTRWKSNDYLCEAMRGRSVTVARTPSHGKGDAVHDGVFVQPQQCQMSFDEALHHIESPDPNCVHYLQLQNGCLNTEFQPLAGDVPQVIPWAKDAFGNDPDAVNFWLGEDRTITSLHQDFYENIFTVVRGCKIVTLLPPSDLPCLDRRKYPSGVFRQRDDGSWCVDADPSRDSTPWIAVDAHHPDLELFPQFTRANPIVVEVHQGEQLFIPKLWFHQVEQRKGDDSLTCAVNHWHDMPYGALFTHLNFLDAVTEQRSSSPPDQVVDS